MKSEERHELKSNDLENLVKSAKPFLEKHGNKLIFGAIAVLVIGVVSVVAMNQSRSARTAGWAALANASTAEDYANIVEDHKGTPVSRMAQLNQANLLLDKGIQFMFTDRSAGNADLKKATELYEELLEDKESLPSIREQALYGRARCLEATAGENTQPAIDAYDKLIQEFGESIYRKKAEERIKSLETAESKEFYKWFQTQNPKPVDRSQPNDVVLPDSIKKSIGTGEVKTEETKTEKEAEAPAEKPEDKKEEASKESAEKKPEAESKPSAEKKAEKKESSTKENKEESPDKK